MLTHAREPYGGIQRVEHVRFLELQVACTVLAALQTERTQHACACDGLRLSALRGDGSGLYDSEIPDAHLACVDEGNVLGSRHARCCSLAAGGRVGPRDAARPQLGPHLPRATACRTSRMKEWMEVLMCACSADQEPAACEVRSGGNGPSQSPCMHTAGTHMRDRPCCPCGHMIVVHQLVP